MRKLSSHFMMQLKQGILQSILHRVQNDDTLFLSIRNKYVSIYYRGGSILKLKESSSDKYQAYFDRKYLKGNSYLQNKVQHIPNIIQSSTDAELWVNAFAYLKEGMDLWLRDHRKSEREYQQVVARENNFSSIANETEYYITDIEYMNPSIGAKADMLGIKWKASDRSRAKNCVPVLIEMKYADSALKGKSGIKKHLQDFHQQINGKHYQEVLKTIQSQFEQLMELGLIEGNFISRGTVPQLDPKIQPEVLLLLANHNPRSKILADVLKDPSVIALINTLQVKFIFNRFAGYGLHEDNILSFQQIKKYI
jgi:hypothetical protein